MSGKDQLVSRFRNDRGLVRENKISLRLGHIPEEGEEKKASQVCGGG